jgi:hypothetical protein
MLLQYGNHWLVLKICCLHERCLSLLIFKSYKSFTHSNQECALLGVAFSGHNMQDAISEPILVLNVSPFVLCQQGKQFNVFRFNHVEQWSLLVFVLMTRINFLQQKVTANLDLVASCCKVKQVFPKLALCREPNS